MNRHDDDGAPRRRVTGAPGLGDQDPLIRLEERLGRASEAAERLIAEAAARAAGKPPPAGWQQREPDPPPGDRSQARAASDELELLVQVFNSLRDRIPPELQKRLGEALREVLLAVRALIDWYLERTERQRADPIEVQDIPIT